MRKLALLAIGIFTVLTTHLFAQDSPDAADGIEAIDSLLEQNEQLTAEERAKLQKESEQACAICGGSMMLLGVSAIILNILLLVWVARDAKNRAMDGSILWMLLVLSLIHI